MNKREVAVAELEGRIGHTFHDRELLERTLTHASVGDGALKVRHYERLEFLGDRVLNLLAAERLMALNPDAREGEMSRLMAGLVNYHACARVARRIGLPNALRMAASATKIGARDNDTVLGDACEALIGALYVDAGLEGARAFFLEFWTDECGSRIRRPSFRNGPRVAAWPCPPTRSSAAKAPTTHRPSPFRLRSATMNRNWRRAVPVRRPRRPPPWRCC
jgi:dsRNA-specific ribonuclease